MAAEQGHLDSYNGLGDCYSYGKGVEQDYAKAVEYYLKSPKYPEIQFRLGECYYHGQGVAKDPMTAFEWFSKSAQGGYTPAIEALANYDFPHTESGQPIDSGSGG